MSLAAEMLFFRADPCARAERLIKRFLTPQQRQDYKQLWGFVVETRDLGPFLIMWDIAYNIISVRTGERFCLKTTEESPIPLADLLLTQKMILECDPNLFVARANMTDSWSRVTERTRAAFCVVRARYGMPTHAYEIRLHECAYEDSQCH